MKPLHGLTPREHIQDVLDLERYVPKHPTPPRRFTAIRWQEGKRWRLLRAMRSESKLRHGRLYRMRLRVKARLYALVR